MADEAKDDVIKEALEQYEESDAGSSDNRENCKSDIRFSRLNEQWPEKILAQRQSEDRPALTINKLKPLIFQVINEARQNKPGINVKPIDNGADVETAQIIGGLIRSIQRNKADIAYDTAIDHAVSGGFGFFRLAIDYAGPDTFDMECRIERVPFPTMVHWDTSTTEFDASDWEYGFISDWLTKGEFEKRYPGAVAVDFGNVETGHAQNWVRDDGVRVAEWFQRTHTKRKLLEITDIATDGRENAFTIREDRLSDMAKSFAVEMGLPQNGIKPDELITLWMEATGSEITKEREVMAPEVVHRIITGSEVLEENPWPGSTIPICPVWGDEIYDADTGIRHFRSMIRDARDPQQMFNFWRSATTELVALAPRAPYIGPEGFVPKGHENKWATANTRSHAYLEYSRSAPTPPQRQPFAGVPAGALQEAMSASDDIKAITGIFDSSIGAESNEKSGKAILARERQSDVGNFHFLDNLNRAIEYAGRCLVEIIPHVYSPRQTVRILGDDEKESVARLASETIRNNPEMQEPYINDDGERLYDLTTGRYDVEITTGPSYASQREEARETLIEIMRSVPGSAPYVGDILMEHMDFSGADKLAERLKHLLPPQVQQAEGMAPQIPQGATPMGGDVPAPPPGMDPQI